MNFEATEDQSAFLDAVTDVARRFGSAWQPTGERQHFAPELDRVLEEGGYFGCTGEESLGPVAAAAMVMALARLPVCAEVAASALVAPLLGGAFADDVPRPLAVLCGDLHRPTRFLPQARTVLYLQGAHPRIARLRPQDVRAVQSAFAYPMGVLRSPEVLEWSEVAPTGGATAQALEDRWRIAIAAEMVGCLLAALDAVVAHVSDRRQFGRPLGAFQGVQHRLAAAASAIEGARWLSLRAAWSGTAEDAAVAIAQVQGISTRIVYDLHQFMGAMGLTLEHPLHRWTYRLKLLRSEFGGAEAGFVGVAGSVEGARAQ